MTGYHDKSFREFTIDDIGPLMAVKWGTSTGIEYEFIAISDYLEVIVVDALFYLQEAQITEEPNILNRFQIDIGMHWPKTIDFVYYNDQISNEKMACILLSKHDMDAFYIIFLNIEGGILSRTIRVDEQLMRCANCD